jgi:mono/diheme cytochrome c family protein
VLADGAALFRERCVMCHGEAGDGNGQLAAALDPRPRDFRRLDWQQSVGDAHIENVISRGGPSVGLSPIMPAHPDLGPGQLASLRAYVRSLAR